MKLPISTVFFAVGLALSPTSARTEPVGPTPAASSAPSPAVTSKGEAPADKADQCSDCSDCHGDEGTALRKLEQEWADAVSQHDTAAIDRIESEDFIATDPSGAVTHKAEDLAMAKSGELQISNFQLTDVKVSVYGETAVVTGKTTFRANVGKQPLGGDYRWTDVFVRREGKWQAVASQATAIASQKVEQTEE